MTSGRPTWTTDFQYVGNDGVTNVYIKKAYVQAKLSDALVFRAGSADLPWVPFVEGSTAIASSRTR